MTSRPQNKAQRSRTVFINCPFDDEYRPLSRAMCFTILLCGYFPRCALDLRDFSQSRFHKILDLIVSAGLSIHDICRVELDDGSKLPRFIPGYSGCDGLLG